MAIKQEFTADASQAKKAIEELIALNQKLVQQNKDLAQQTSRNARDFSRSINDHVVGIKEMVAGYFSVQAAIALVGSEYGKWADKMDKLAEKSAKLNADLIKQMVAVGQVAQLGEMREFIGKIPGATRAQGEAVLSGITGGGAGLSMERKKGLIAKIAPLAPAGVDGARTGLAASRLAEVMPEKSPDDIADLTLQMQHKFGTVEASQLETEEFARSIGMLKTAGLSSDEALGLARAAVAKRQAPGMLAKVSGVLSGEQSVQFKRGRDQKAWDADDAKARMRMLQDNREIREQALGARFSPKFAEIGSAGFASETADITRGQREDYASGILPGLGRDIGGREALAANNRELLRDKEWRLEEAKRKARKAADEEIEIVQKQAGWNVASKALHSGLRQVGRFGEWMRGGSAETDLPSGEEGGAYTPAEAARIQKAYATGGGDEAKALLKEVRLLRESAERAENQRSRAATAGRNVQGE